MLATCWTALQTYVRQHRHLAQLVQAHKQRLSQAFVCFVCICCVCACVCARASACERASACARACVRARALARARARACVHHLPPKYKLLTQRARHRYRVRTDTITCICAHKKTITFFPSAVLLFEMHQCSAQQTIQTPQAHTYHIIPVTAKQRLRGMLNSTNYANTTGTVTQHRHRARTHPRVEFRHAERHHRYRSMGLVYLSLSVVGLLCQG